MLEFIRIFLSTILALFALCLICILAVPFIMLFWPIIIMALPVALLIYIIQKLEEKNKKKNKKKIGF